MLTRSCFSFRVFTKPQEPLLNTTVCRLTGLPPTCAEGLVLPLEDDFVVGYPGRQAEPLELFMLFWVSISCLFRMLGPELGWEFFGQPSCRLSINLILIPRTASLNT